MPSPYPRIVVAVLLCGSLPACNFSPDDRPPKIDIPASYKEADTRQPAQPTQAAVDSARGPWWEHFGDRVLSSLETRIENANPDLAAAVARYDQARALAAEAAAGLMPQIVAEGSLSDNKQSLNRPLRILPSKQPTYYGANQLGASVGYEVDFWGRIRNQAAAGTASAQASAADLATMRLSLQAELATIYFQLRGLDDQMAVLDDSIAAYQKARDLTQRLFDARLIPRMDVFRARTQLEDARAQSAAIAARRAMTEHAIAVLTGTAASSFSLPPATQISAPPAVPAGLPSTLLQRRPDIAAAAHRITAAAKVVGTAKAAFFPSLTLGVVGGFQSAQIDMLSVHNTLWSLGPKVTLPLFEGGRLNAQKSAAYAQLHEAEANYRSIVLAAVRDVEDALAELRWLEQEAAARNASAEDARRTFDAAMTLYRQGADSYLNVVTAQASLLQEQQSQRDIRMRQLLANVSLIKALGGGWEAKANCSSHVMTISLVRHAIPCPL
ncbi:efflux transporter outer membrane subunit [Acetobacter sp.]|uniref:efflux transporter outer membrane subunit n=1 Tax=Acetobacter sp. TaxID=440 RepID=UPI0025C04BEF|nr:efflux transporter outer membrane subunit [Acetobacter sp.]MCH4092006.1 efflux transporter outer membrane subunit [Acetobacter sp.]MCI1300740.1 efflux transporter outer membrane subunit [Acetobacter sp.]MCI1317508.1 efflux transporter outer membrane subunit [Acetobacter sp.]